MKVQWLMNNAWRLQWLKDLYDVYSLINMRVQWLMNIAWPIYTGGMIYMCVER